MGLLVLRIAVACAVIPTGLLCLRESPERTIFLWVLGSTAVLSGVLLLLGYLTRIGGVLAVLSSVGETLSLSHSGKTVFDIGALTALEVAIGLALVFIGPGAFSCDARLFGRREIVIPRPSSPSS